MPDKIYVAEFDAENKLYLKKLQQAERRTTRTIGKMQQSVANYGKTMLASFGVYQAFAFMNRAIELYKVQEQAVRKLDTALGYNTISLQRYAASLQRVTTYGDEVIIDAMALLGAFVKDEEQIKKLTKATLDLAVAKGMDLVAAADLVSKTVGSSTNALSRYGIQVNGAVGSTERLESTVQSISDLFGGQATEQAKTYTGQLQQMENATSDNYEIVGKNLIPVMAELSKMLLTLSGFAGRVAEDVGLMGESWADFWMIMSGQGSEAPSRLKKNAEELAGLLMKTYGDENKQNKRVKTEEEIAAQLKLQKELREEQVDAAQKLADILQNDIWDAQKEDEDLILEDSMAPHTALMNWRNSIRPIDSGKGLVNLVDPDQVDETTNAMNALVGLSSQMASNFQFAGHTFVGQLNNALSMVNSISNMILTVASIFTNVGGFGIGGLLSLIGLEKGGRITNGKVGAIPSFASGGSYSTPSMGGAYPFVAHRNETIDVYNAGQTSRMEKKMDEIKGAIMAGTLAATRKGGSGNVNVYLDGKKLFEINEGRSNRAGRSGKNTSEIL